MVPIGLVYSIHDPTEVAIQKMIDASKVMLETNTQGGEGAAGGGLKKNKKRERQREKKKGLETKYFHNPVLLYLLQLHYSL
jgi:hypothetical protein